MVSITRFLQEVDLPAWSLRYVAWSNDSTIDRNASCEKQLHRVKEHFAGLNERVSMCDLNERRELDRRKVLLED